MKWTASIIAAAAATAMPSQAQDFGGVFGGMMPAIQTTTGITYSEQQRAPQC